MARSLSITVALLCATSSLAFAKTKGGSDEFDDVILTPPPTYQANDVLVEQHLGAKLPIDTPFRTSQGTPILLGEALRGELPTILTFNYSDCPMLCSMQLNGLTAAMPGVAGGDPPMKIGVQFRIVTIDLEPNEPIEKLAKMKERYIARLPEADRAAARTGWTFLASGMPGTQAGIRRVADAVGFHYNFVPERNEWAHPAALIFVSTKGTVTRYVFGIEYDVAMLRQSIFSAGISESATAVGFMNRCYHYDPDANNASQIGMAALRYAAAGFAVLVLGGLILVHMIRKQTRPTRSNGAVS